MKTDFEVRMQVWLNDGLTEEQARKIIEYQGDKMTMAESAAILGERSLDFCYELFKGLGIIRLIGKLHFLTPRKWVQDRMEKK